MHYRGVKNGTFLMIQDNSMSTTTKNLNAANVHYEVLAIESVTEVQKTTPL